MCWGLRELTQATDILPMEIGLGNQRTVIDNPINSVNLRVGLAARGTIQETVKWLKAHKSRTYLHSD